MMGITNTPVFTYYLLFVSLRLFTLCLMQTLSLCAYMILRLIPLRVEL